MQPQYPTYMFYVEMIASCYSTPGVPICDVLPSYNLRLVI